MLLYKRIIFSQEIIPFLLEHFHILLKDKEK